jgi:hypothetical protein
MDHRYVDQLEVKEQDAGDPLVDSHIGLDIRVVQHAFEILSIYLHDKIFHSDDIDSVGTEGAEQTIQLQLCLGVSRFMCCPCYGSKSARILAFIVSNLH